MTLSPPSFRRILVAVDFGLSSERAVATGAALATSVGATLILIHAWDVEAAVEPTPDCSLSDAAAQAREGAQRSLDALAERVRGLHADTEARLVLGSPAVAIARAINEERADLLVMGTHGRTGLAHTFLGSIAERMVRVAPIPVLTVRGGADASAAAVVGSHATS